MTNLEIETDVAVVGSGAAGLTAALLAHDHGARVVVLERSDAAGGATAVSGGALWVPLNHHMSDIGATDSRDEALAYCKRLTAGLAPDELVEAFVDTGHEMVRYLEERTPLKLRVWTMPDYHPAIEGAKRGGRSLEPELFRTSDLGAWEELLRQPSVFPLPLSLQERTFQYQAMLRPQDVPVELIAERQAQGLVAGGNALAGALLKGCLNRGIEILLGTRARALPMEGGRVTGLRAERAGADVVVRARAVVLASGGFEWNERLKGEFLPGPVSHPNSPPGNEGDGLIMAQEASAALANMSEVWGSPAAAVPGETYEGRPLSRLVVPERACPHSILVNRRGERFVNEGMRYNELGKVFNDVDPTTHEYANQPCWAVFDRQYRERYPVLTVLAADPDPSWLIRDETLEGVARQAGIDAAGLRATVVRWNEFVHVGNDRDFGRHRSPMDPSAAHPSMGSIEQPQFYALA
ncbi:MAG: FAD-dependent oxidoreductase, partial [Dehalococcoidia bacterium]